MKFTPSSSVSSSTTSTTTSSFRENFCTSKGSSFGCLAGFLSRILCSKTLPTHPTYPIETETRQNFLKIVDGSTTPNVVARLMGLDSMPEFDSGIPHKAADSIKQVKPLNSGNLREEETGEMQGKQHRRAKTSFSFKETPDFFELEDDDFFAPRKPEKEKKNKKKKKKKKRELKFGNSEVGLKGYKQGGRREKCGSKQCRNREEQSKDRVFSIEDRLSLKISAQNSQQFDNNVGVRNQSYHLSPLKEKPSSSKDETDGIKARRKKKKKKENCLVDSKEECDSENLSPVSVLDHSEFSSDPEAATSEEDARLRRSKAGDDFEGRDFPCEGNNENQMWEEREREGRGERMGIKKRECRRQERGETLGRAYRLAEAEIANNSKWKYRGMLATQELEDAGAGVGQLIFDHLVIELVHQLLGLQ